MCDASLLVSLEEVVEQKMMTNQRLQQQTDPTLLSVCLWVS